MVGVLLCDYSTELYEFVTYGLQSEVWSEVLLDRTPVPP